MATVAGTIREECESLGAKASDVWRRASRMTEEVGALKGAAKDLLDGAAEAAERTVEDTIGGVRRRARDLRYVPDDAAYRIRHAPLRSVGGALALGVLAGVLFGWMASRTLGRSAGPREE